MANAESIRSEDFTDGQFESSCTTTFKKATFRYTWSICDFRDYCVANGTEIESSIFSDGTKDGLKWCLKINPNAWQLKTKYLAVRVFLLSNINVNLETCCKLSILNYNLEQMQKREICIQFSKSNPFGSFDAFIEKDILLDPKNKILDGKKLTILCEIVVFGSSENFSGQLAMPNDLGRTLFNNSDYSVVTFSIAGIKLQALKTILIAKSSVFREMLQHDSVNQIEIVDVNYEDFKGMLYFMYTNTINNINYKSAGRLFVAADKYALENLKYMCEEWMSKNLSYKNAAEYYVLANQHNGDNMLKIRTKLYITANAPAVVKTIEFKIALKEHRLLFQNLGLPNV